jgi:hypothetical protein
MIAARLILSAPIGGTQVEGVVRPQIVLHPEREAHKAARALPGTRRRLSGDFSLDGPVRECESFDRSQELD